MKFEITEYFFIRSEGYSRKAFQDKTEVMDRTNDGLGEPTLPENYLNKETLSLTSTLPYRHLCSPTIIYNHHPSMIDISTTLGERLSILTLNVSTKLNLNSTLQTLSSSLTVSKVCLTSQTNPTQQLPSPNL